jgi:hypothetical protein
VCVRERKSENERRKNKEVEKKKQKGGSKNQRN